MKLDIGGEEIFEVPIETLWRALNEPAVLQKCIPGCKDMIPQGGDRFKLILNLKVASVGGSFEGEISLSDKTPPAQCNVAVSGAGTLGHGSGSATFALSAPNGATAMRYSGQGEIGGLVAGVGQRILKGVAKHLIKQFFTALRREVTAPSPAQSPLAAEFPMQPDRAFTLSAHGAQMPAIGYGTMELPERGAELVAYAIQSGYRLIDTARKYGTEERVGEGIRASGIARAELWVTTKVTELDAREADFLRSVETSLKALQLDYVDLLLVHWPQPKVPFAETLGALAKAKRSGLTRHIGVSNFTIAMLDETAQVCPEPLITNQIEYHAYLPQDRMLAALKRHGMILTAYCPMARGKLLDEPVIAAIAKARGKTIGQICLRWLIQQPMVAAVPRPLEEAHIREDLDVLDWSLSEDEMRRISALRSRHIRIADPPERAPQWDVETVG